MKRVLVREEYSRKILEKKIFGRFFPRLIFRERSAPTIYLYETTIRRFLDIYRDYDCRPYWIILFYHGIARGDAKSKVLRL